MGINIPKNHRHLIANDEERDKVSESIESLKGIIESSFTNSETFQIKSTGQLLNAFLKLLQVEILTYGHYGNITLHLKKYTEVIKDANIEHFETKGE